MAANSRKIRSRRGQRPSISDERPPKNGSMGLSQMERLEKIKRDVEKMTENFSKDDVKGFESLVPLIDDALVEEYNKKYEGVRRVILDRNERGRLNNRRSEIEVLASILDVAIQGVNKTRILYKANLSYTQLKNYLLFLMDKGLLEEDAGADRRKVYCTTDKGLTFLTQWGKVLPLLE